MEIDLVYFPYPVQVGHTRQAVEQDVAHADGMARDAYPPNTVIAAIRRERNMSLPVSRMPAEILTEIFSYLPYETKRIAPLPDVVRISHVCSQWREIAIAYPHLWTHLYYFKHIDCVQTFLDRSGAIPLHICYNRGLGESDSCWHNFRRAMGQLARVRELEISGAVDFEERFPSAFKHDINRPAPLLEVFRIDASDEFLRGRGVHLHGDILPATLFANNAPVLRSFYARGTNVPWSNPHFVSNLTEFHVCASNYNWAAQPTLSALLATLQQCPQLEVLTFDGLASRRPQDPNQIPVQLPSLRKFKLRTKSLPDYTLFLSNVIMNVDVEWNIEVIWDFTGNNEAPIMITPRFLGEVEYEYITLEIGKSSVIFKVTKADGTRNTSCLDISPIRRHTPNNEPDERIFSVIRTVVENNAWSAIEEVRVKLAVPRMIPKACWTRFFSAFSHLMDLTYDVPRSSNYDFSENLLETLKESDVLVLGSCIAYSLYNIRLINANFHQTKLFDRLLEFLRLRWHHGRPITEMHITNAYGLTYLMVKKIEKLVDLVEWDGLETKFDYVEDFPKYIPGNERNRDDEADFEVANVANVANHIPVADLNLMPELNFDELDDDFMDDLEDGDFNDLPDIALDEPFDGEEIQDF